MANVADAIEVERLFSLLSMEGKQTVVQRNNDRNIRGNTLTLHKVGTVLSADEMLAKPVGDLGHLDKRVTLTNFGVKVPFGDKAAVNSAFADNLDRMSISTASGGPPEAGEEAQPAPVAARTRAPAYRAAVETPVVQEDVVQAGAALSPRDEIAALKLRLKQAGIFGESDSINMQDMRAKMKDRVAIPATMKAAADLYRLALANKELLV